MLSFLRKKPADFFSVEEKKVLLEAIEQAERTTSGEVRLYVESHCRFVDPLDRAAEVFYSLKMNETALKNGVLVYVAIKDKQLAIFGDEGIHTKVGQAFWQTQVTHIVQQVRQQHLAQGLVNVITDIGQALHRHFPYDPATDKNELPDDIVFGR
jgi:uncharacterized membrane protein